MRKIVIQVGQTEVKAALNDSKTADLIYEALPMEETYNTWGDEIYFGIPVRAELEDGQEVVGLGDLGYWPPGHAFCIFYGRTPVSRGEEIRPASPVNVVGKVTGDPKVLKKVARSGDRIRLERV